MTIDPRCSDDFKRRIGPATHGNICRLQQADAFYGPEIWTDEVGTNQLLLIADRRGITPFVVQADQQWRIDEALQRDPEIALVVPNIQITAANGAIILTGSVQSDEQKRQIMAKVLQVSGVVAVNNQLSVIAGPNGGQGAGGLNPTSNSGSERLYKDSANGPDNSTNNVLNPTSGDNGSTQLYRESTQGVNNDSSGELNPTSRGNGNSQIYQGNPGEKAQDQNSILNTNNIQQVP